MTKEISNFALFRFFYKWLSTAFADLGRRDESIIHYISAMLSRFARTDNLYRIKSVGTKALYTAVEMLLEAEERTHPHLEKFNPFEEREIRKHLGDYTLFMTGIFRNYVEHLGVLDFYQTEGKRCYLAVYELDHITERNDPTVFSKLGRAFEDFSGALDYMKKVYFRPEMHGGDELDLVKRLSVW